MKKISDMAKMSSPKGQAISASSSTEKMNLCRKKDGILANFTR